ncbi:hypothetical protein GGQ91_002488 [Methylobacterium fujisawaense]|uniref:Thoeris anti-defense 2-like domain-containing protein n=1 Tax=Methylobacterium fujisawaense TaxID=107400 RepID=A0ABR6DBC6_9HYPH|nr:DUF2829 domain-containing protein [Methylobacterium fujisawaense]MBA9063100.1 hypothetical protein [Methylobacterium fujisawaense]
MGIGPKAAIGDVVPADQGVVIGSQLPPFSPTHVSHKQVEAYLIVAAEFQSDGSGRIALKGGILIDVPAGFASRGAPTEGDMLVRYEPIPGQSDGYLSHSPRMVFEAGYSPIERPFTSGLGFGDAILALKGGERVCRAGWNGKGMWLALTQGTPDLPAEKFWNRHNRAFAEQNGGAATVLPSITMKTAMGEILMGWLASQTDMLAEDWMVLPADAA